MWMKTSKRQSRRPASTTRTRTEGSADSRLARAQPADPPPTITKSYTPTACHLRSVIRDLMTDILRCPSMAKRADAIIIGAGVIGAAVAFELGKRGYQTLNIDKLPASGYGPTSN